MLGAGWERKRKLVLEPDCDTPAAGNRMGGLPQHTLLPSPGRGPDALRGNASCPTVPGAAFRSTHSPSKGPQMLRQLPGQHESPAPLTTHHMMTITSINGAPILGWASGQFTNIILCLSCMAVPIVTAVPQRNEMTPSRTQITRAGLRPSSHFLAFISFCSCHWCLFLFSSPKYGHFPRFSLSSLEKLLFSKSLSHCG